MPRPASPAPVTPKSPSTSAALSSENAALIRRFLDALSNEGRAAATRATYALDLELFAGDLGPQSILAVSKDDVLTWLANNTRLRAEDPPCGRSWTPRTRNRKLAALKSFYRWAAEPEQALVARVPTQTVKALKVDAFRAPVRIRRQELRRLFEHLDHQVQLREERDAPLFLLDLVVLRLCYHLGLRISEALSMRFSLRSRIRNAPGTHADDLLWQFRTKGGALREDLLAGVVRQDLERWLRVRAGIAPKPGAADHVFIHPWSGRPVTRKRSWERLKQTGEALGLAAEVQEVLSPHKLRHAAAYDSLDDGESLASVQALLGHKNVATTSVYIQDDQQARLDMLRRRSRDVRG